MSSTHPQTLFRPKQQYGAPLPRHPFSVTTEEATVMGSSTGRLAVGQKVWVVAIDPYSYSCGVVSKDPHTTSPSPDHWIPRGDLTIKDEEYIDSQLAWLKKQERATTLKRLKHFGNSGSLRSLLKGSQSV
jgi:hypothetical protein